MPISTNSISTTIKEQREFEFSITGPTMSPEGTGAQYSISYTGDLEPGETVSVDVEHLLGETASTDYSTSVITAVQMPLTMTQTSVSMARPSHSETLADVSSTSMDFPRAVINIDNNEDEPWDIGVDPITGA
ncbi:MAG: hypothetical protein R3C02_18770 [Planctomycetaceae bacterium]